MQKPTADLSAMANQAVASAGHAKVEAETLMQEGAAAAAGQFGKLNVSGVGQAAAAAVGATEEASSTSKPPAKASDDYEVPSLPGASAGTVKPPAAAVGTALADVAAAKPQAAAGTAIVQETLTSTTEPTTGATTNQYSATAVGLDAAGKPNVAQQASTYITQADHLIDGLKGKKFMGGKFDNLIDEADKLIEGAKSSGFFGSQSSAPAAAASGGAAGAGATAGKAEGTGSAAGQQ